MRIISQADLLGDHKKTQGKDFLSFCFPSVSFSAKGHASLLPTIYSLETCTELAPGSPQGYQEVVIAHSCTCIHAYIPPQTHTCRDVCASTWRAPTGEHRGMCVCTHPTQMSICPYSAQIQPSGMKEETKRALFLGGESEATVAGYEGV